jgi:riboflavin synthase
MFTGIVEATGTVEAICHHPDGGARLTIRAFPMTVGESLAINGVCLTVQQAEGERLHFDAVPETLRRTNLGDLKGRRPRELGATPHARKPTGRAFRPRACGHDGATLVEVRPEGNAHVMRFQLDDTRYMRYIVPKGSIAVDGISLTVVDVGDDWFTVWIIPHTWQVTNLHARQVGERVNIETDILARYVERLLETRLNSSEPTAGS